MQMGMYGMGMSNFQHANHSAIASFSKGKAKEIDFEAAFSQLAESVERGASVIETTDDTTKDLEKALENVSLNENKDQKTDDGAHGYVASGRKGCKSLNITPQHVERTLENRKFSFKRGTG